MFQHHRLRNIPDWFVAISSCEGGRDYFARFSILQNNQIYEKTL